MEVCTDFADARNASFPGKICCDIYLFMELWQLRDSECIPCINKSVFPFFFCIFSFFFVFVFVLFF